MDKVEPIVVKKAADFSRPRAVISIPGKAGLSDPSSFHLGMWIISIKKVQELSMGP